MQPRTSLLLAVVIAALVAVVLLLRLLFAAPLAAVERLAESFRQGKITETFIASLPVAADAGRGRLEVATLEATETLRREDDQTVLWNMLPLGTTTVEIRVPVVYRYHLDLAEPWEVLVEGRVCTVIAPALRPTVPVAIRTEGLEKRIENGWARFDGAAQLDDLERSLTAHLTASARHPSRVGLARDPARRTVAAFARDWLLREQAWGTNGINTIVVRFADEDEVAEPTLRWRLGDPESSR